jgi:hypothetical protein
MKISENLFPRGIQYLSRLRLQHRSGRKQQSQKKEATNATLHTFRTCLNGLMVPNNLSTDWCCGNFWGISVEEKEGGAIAATL